MEYFVSPNGSDTNNGTIESPFASISQAATACKSGDIVTISSGTYRETVNPPSGTTFRAKSGDLVIINGSDIIENWTPDIDSIYKSVSWDLGDGCNQLFIGGAMSPEARWPKIGNDISNPVKSSTTGMKIISPTQGQLIDTAISQPDGFWNGASIHLMAGQEWMCDYGSVISHAGKQLTFTYSISNPDLLSYEQPIVGNHYYLYGIKNAMTQPGDWIVQNGYIYLYGNPSQFRTSEGGVACIEMKRRFNGFILNGRSNVTIQGITLFSCTISTDANSKGNVIDGITAKFVSHFTKWNGFSTPKHDGIIINGTDNKIINSEISYTAGAGVVATGSNNIVNNCYIHNINYAATDAGGVSLCWGNGHQVTNNTIYNCGGDGIRHGISTGYIIYGNWIYKCFLQCTNGGDIYASVTNDKGSVGLHNIVQDAGGLISAGCSNHPFNVMPPIVETVLSSTVLPTVNEISVVPVSPPSDRRSTKLILANSYDSKSSGLQLAEPTTAIGMTNNGDWLCYKQITFSGMKMFYANVAVHSNCAGRLMELRLNSVSGQVIGELKPQSTGDTYPDSWFNFTLQSTPVTIPDGVYDLYIVFKAAAVCNIMSFIFADA